MNTPVPEQLYRIRSEKPLPVRELGATLHLDLGKIVPVTLVPVPGLRDERADFEKWAKDYPFDMRQHLPSKYSDAATQMAELGWTARAALFGEGAVKSPESIFIEELYELEPSLKTEGLERFDGYFVHWNEIIEFCHRVGGVEGYTQSPLELISRIIDQRDEALAAKQPSPAPASLAEALSLMMAAFDVGYSDEEIRKDITNYPPTKMRLEAILAGREALRARTGQNGSFEQLHANHIAWVRETFPDESILDQIKHLKEEVEELESVPGDPEEWADALMLVLAGADNAGVDIFTAFAEKLKKNKSRTWTKTERGYRHVPPTAETGPDVDPDGVSYKGLMAASAALLKALPSPQECAERAAETGVEKCDLCDGKGSPEGCFICGLKTPPGPYPFNLTRALAGAALVTRGGQTAKDFRESAETRTNGFPYRVTLPGFCPTVTANGTYWTSGEHEWDLFLRDPDPSAPPVPEACPMCGLEIPHSHDVCKALAPVIQPKAEPSETPWTDFAKTFVPSDEQPAPDADGECEKTVNRLRKGIQWAMDGGSEQTTEKSLANVLQRLRIVLADRKIHAMASPPAEGGAGE